MLKIALIIVAVLALSLGAVVVFAATRPDTFQVQRSLAIKAPAGKIYPLIASLRRMQEWTPFVSDDKSTRYSYTGPESGVGASHDWDAKDRLGKGRIEITETTAPSRVVMKLDMSRPVEAHNRVDFILAESGGMTTVTWAMQGGQPLPARIFSLFVDFDKMVGGEFEKGLRQLQALAEK